MADWLLIRLPRTAEQPATWLTVDDAWDRITAGASLLQGYTGFIYGGGLWAKNIHDGIAQRLHEGGFSSLADAVGSSAQ